MKKLENKVAVVTGGTSGIGLASARLFLEEGAQVVLFARAYSDLTRAAVPVDSSMRSGTPER